jgi:DNA polymerase-3 subunit delta
VARSGALDAASLKKELAAGKIAPVYLFHGEEAFQKEEALASLRGAVLGGEGEAEGDSAGWSLTVLEGGSASLAEILDASRTLPMFSLRRLVLVKDAERIKESDADPLKQYLKAPVPTTCLVFAAGTGKPDFRRAVFRALQERAKVAEFPAVKGASLPSWIRHRLRERGAEIEPEALALLESLGVADLFRVDQELTKVLEFLSPSTRITAEALGETLGTAAAGSIFEMAERAGAGEVGEAIRLLRSLLAEGEEPTRLLFLIARHLRILILGKSLLEKGLRGRELAQGLGIPPYPFILEKTTRLIGRFPESAAGPSLRRVLEADRALKGGVRKGPAVLEGLILDLGALIGEPKRGEATR